MNKTELNERLRKAAIDCGLCEQWQHEWENDWDSTKMISQFYRGIDFFLDKRFISNEFIKENFDKDFLRKWGILVDDTYSLLNARHAILIGDSTSTIRINNHNVSEIYVIDNSKAKIIAKDNAKVIVRLLGKAQIEVEKKGSANVTVINHSKDSVIISNDNIKIREDYNLFLG